MHLSYLLSTLELICLIQASAILPRAGDSSLDSNIEEREFNTTELPSGTIHCGCGFNMVHAYTDAAVQGLKDSLPAKNIPINGPLVYSTMIEDVVAFICKRGDNAGATVFSAGDVANAIAQVTAACGLYVAGTYVVILGLAHVDIGYMRWDPNFCSAAEGSGATSCH